MTETWLDFCTKLEGPREKGGYWLVWEGEFQLAQSTPLTNKEGSVHHSMEGPLTAGVSELMRLSRRAIWHFSVPKRPFMTTEGLMECYQHYPLEWICWHCGVKGDRSHDTSLIGNITLIGIENEGRAGEPLTEHQTLMNQRIVTDYRRLIVEAGGTIGPRVRAVA